ncbi:hypothetical protein SESBI_48853 [Sesbania bispinosa]|nr:hypothetical protein SESBI_48853 [Sesbania bispinosa]
MMWIISTTHAVGMVDFSVPPPSSQRREYCMASWIFSGSFRAIVASKAHCVGLVEHVGLKVEVGDWF